MTSSLKRNRTLNHILDVLDIMEPISPDQWQEIDSALQDLQLEAGDDVCCDAGDGDAVYRKMTATLGMTLRLDERGIYDCESESYIHDDGIDVVADNVIAWLDGSGIIDDQGNASPDDLTGEYASDWDAVVAMFDQWEKIKLSQ